MEKNKKNKNGWMKGFKYSPLKNEWRDNKFVYDATICTSHDFISDLKWWYVNIQCMKTTIRREPSLLQMLPDVIVDWGAVLDELQTGNPLTFLNIHT